MMSDDEILKKIDDTTRDATRHQLETLLTILRLNAAVPYLQPYLGGLCDDAPTFRRSVPLSCYDDYADHILRMADDRNYQPLLSVDPLICFFYSSGTSSTRPKLIPHFDSIPSKAISKLAHRVGAIILRRLFPPRSSANKFLGFIYSGNVTETKGGYKVMAASSYPLHSSNSNPSHFLSLCVSPKEVILGSDVQQQMYCHLLCGLRYSNLVDEIRAPYAVGLIKAIDFFESKWEQLCADLEHGLPSLEVDVTMRGSVIEVLGGPQEDLSKKIRSVCEGKNWGGIVSKLWPNVRYIKCVTTGSMSQYYSKLKYYAGEVPVLGGDFFASECCVGINLDIMQPPELTQYVMLPTAAYFEFLPFDLSTNSVVGGETVELSGVEVGKFYELVVTTYQGLYRYRLGDIVKVVGFYNSSPKIEFVMRAPKTPGEIITERDLMSAMTSIEPMLGSRTVAKIVDFAAFFDMELIPKQLKIFIEVEKGSTFLQKEKLQESVEVVGSCRSVLEDGMGGIYKVTRARGEVGPLLVCIVKPGSFDALSTVAIENGAPANQYKPPRIIRNHKFVEFMEDSTVFTVCL